MTTRSRPVLGLIGKKRSGKDTLASFLVEDHGWTRVAFADPLREACLGLDPLVRVEPDEVHLLTGGGNPQDAAIWRLAPLVDLVGWEKAKEIREVRRTLQRYGVAIREVDPGFWLRTALARIEAADGPVVVTDVRFPNEADAIDERGATVRIVRPGLTYPTDEHVSETALDDRPTAFTVLNDSTVDYLRHAAKFLSDVAGY